MIGISLPESVTEALLSSGLCERAQADDAAPITANPPSVSQCETVGESSKTFIQPVWFNRLQFALSGSPLIRGACLFGPRGSGKTTAVHELARVSGVELVTFQAAAGNTIDDLVGQRDLVDGKTVFTDGPLPEALQRDCWLFIEEANVMHPGTFSKLNTLTDGSGDALRLPDGRRLAAGARFRVILAFNEGSQYAGTREVNAALRDRLMPIYCDYMASGDEQRVIATQTGCDDETAVRMVAMAESIRAARSSLMFDLSPRALTRMLLLIRCCGESWLDALEHAILDLIGDPIDRAPQRETVRQIALAAGIESWPAPVFQTGGVA